MIGNHLVVRGPLSWMVGTLLNASWSMVILLGRAAVPDRVNIVLQILVNQAHFSANLCGLIMSFRFGVWVIKRLSRRAQDPFKGTLLIHFMDCAQMMDGWGFDGAWWMGSAIWWSLAGGC